ncbi:MULTISPECIES: Ig-like domain-containing protein [unclassified Pseudomonas]|uniref:Ig-like domain-containing protein n=1 Tax=unclassified Pseudomonas TaxID=196821 RepID=UPI000A1DF4BA|nr:MULTISPECIES: Ig-like domain-containing protein [unclassified Pseudomonas]
MSNQGVLANQNLVINGSFELILTNWTRYPRNSPWITVSSQMYNGTPINTLAAGYGASISQEIVAPITPGQAARYVLKFLCESRHEGIALVRLASANMAPVDIQIPPGNQRNTGQPLDFVPVEYEVVLPSTFSAEDILTFSLTSPPSSPDDYHLLVYLSGVVIELHLGPLKLKEFVLDGQSHSPASLVPLCLGAENTETHTLGFQVEEGNIWERTAYSLEFGSNPDGAVVAYPDASIDHPLHEGRTLSCPALSLSAPHPMTLTLWNQYHADPYELQASLWHHRLDFLDVLHPAYFPVLALNQSVRLGVQAASFYTGQTLEGVPVTWTVAGSSIQVNVTTDANGWAYLDYRPDAAGVFNIVASVPSLYYTSGVVTQNLEVKVLATDPWAEVMAVVADKSEPWALKTGWPNRGADYDLRITVPAVLVETDLSLGWKGDSQEQLEVDVNPQIDEEVPVTPSLELLWKMANGDELDGRFQLNLTCSKLLLPSADKAMRLARNELEIGRVLEADKTCVVDEQESATVQVEVLHKVTSGNGDPVLGALAKWMLPDGTIVHSTTGAGGWTSITYQPTSAGDHVIVVHIQAHPDAMPIEHTFFISAIATSPWKSEVTFLLDGVEVQHNMLGVLCRRGQTHALKVLPNAGSAWIGRNISVNWRGGDPDIGLAISDLGTSKTLVAEGVEWTFASEAASSLSRQFQVEFGLEGEPTVRELSGRLMHVDLKEELSLSLDQVPRLLSGQQFDPCLGAVHSFNVLPYALSPLLGLNIWLKWTGTSPDQLGASIKPAPDQPHRLNASGVQWALDFTAAVAGLFNLTVSVPELNFVAVATPMKLDHNKLRLIRLRDPAVDPVIGLDTAWIWAWVVSHFTGKPVAGAPVIWEAEGTPIEVKTDAEGVSGFAYIPKAPGEHRVTSSVVSPFDDFKESLSTSATALPSDPWDEVRSSMDGLTTVPVGKQTYFPRRKAQHSLEVSAPAGNALIGRHLTLGMGGNAPSKLGFVFATPNILGLAQAFHGNLRYPFSVSDLRDGSCTFRLGAERLARLSPPIHMSVGSSEQLLKFAPASRVTNTLFWGQVFKAEVVVNSSISARPVVGASVGWSGAGRVKSTSDTDYYGKATISFIPDVPGPGELKATVGQGEFSDSVTLPYTMLDPRLIESLTTPNSHVSPGQNVVGNITVVSALDGKPLRDVKVDWAFGDLIIPPTFTDAAGKSQVQFMVLGFISELLIATVQGGMGGGQYKHIEFTGLANI